MSNLFKQGLQQWEDVEQQLQQKDDYTLQLYSGTLNAEQSLRVASESLTAVIENVDGMDWQRDYPLHIPDTDIRDTRFSYLCSLAVQRIKTLLD